MTALLSSSEDVRERKDAKIDSVFSSTGEERTKGKSVCNNRGCLKLHCLFEHLYCQLEEKGSISGFTEIIMIKWFQRRVFLVLFWLGYFCF